MVHLFRAWLINIGGSYSGTSFRASTLFIASKEVKQKLEWMLDCQLKDDYIGKNPIAFYPMNQTTNVGSTVLPLIDLLCRSFLLVVVELRPRTQLMLK